jgi:hypothetical protein
MDSEDERLRPNEERKGSPPLGRLVWRTVLALLAAGAGYVGGLASGGGYGGTYALDFSFLGMPGYEGSASMAGVVAGGTILLVAGLSFWLFRRWSTAAMIIIGAYIGILAGAPLFFPIIAPSVGLFALAYFGCGVIGALVGLIIGSLTSHRKRKA